MAAYLIVLLVMLVTVILQSYEAWYYRKRFHWERLEYRQLEGQYDELKRMSEKWDTEMQQCRRQVMDLRENNSLLQRKYIDCMSK